MTQSVSLAETNDQRDAIVDGRIPQGEQLREVPPARVLGTGRRTVREAIETAAVSQILERPEPVDTSPLLDALAELRKTLLRRARIPDEAVAAEHPDPRTTGSDCRAPAPIGAAHRRRACARDGRPRSRELGGGESHG
jgi:DNA-binding GntR family transcriptional regulator